MGTEEQVALALTPVVRAAGLEIWDVERSGANLRVLVERPGGVDLDALSELSGVLSALLDGRDDLAPAGRYVLEVSSPGLERRLRHPWHFASSVGKEVALKTREPFFGSRRLTGKLVAATETDITLALVAEGEERQVTVPLLAVERAHVVFRWPEAPARSPRGARRPSRPGRSRRDSPANAGASSGGASGAQGSQGAA